jgi:hypothetical protein
MASFLKPLRLLSVYGTGTSSGRTLLRRLIRKLCPCSTAIPHVDIYFRLMKRQLAFILARAQIPIEWLQSNAYDDADGDAEIDFQDDLPDELLECLSNTRLSAYFRDFGKELGVADAKSLEDVYKSHLENTRNEFRQSFCGSFCLSSVCFLAMNRTNGDSECRLCAREPCWNVRQRICQRRIWQRQAHGRS